MINTHKINAQVLIGALLDATYRSQERNHNHSAWELLEQAELFLPLVSEEHRPSYAAIISDNQKEVEYRIQLDEKEKA